MTMLPDLTISGEDVARLLYVAREIASEEEPEEFMRLVANAFLATVRHRHGLPALDSWIKEEQLDRLEKAGVFPFWAPPQNGE